MRFSASATPLSWFLPGLPLALALVLAASPVRAQVTRDDAADRDSLTITDAVAEDEPQGLDDELNQSFLAYKRLLESGRYASAIETAKRVIVLSIEVNGREHLQTARALTNLAIAQHKNGEYEAAEQNYRAAIKIVETIESRLSKHLVNPLRGLGNTYLQAGRPDQAIAAYDRAVHLTHVNSGPQNLEQVDLLEALSESFLRLRDLEEAEDVQQLSYQLYQRRYGDDDPRLLPAMERRARWLHRLGLFAEERYVYNRIIDIIEENYGEDDLRLIEPLNGLARTHLYDVESLPSNRGEWALKRAVEIAESHPESSPNLVADTLISRGDYFGLRGQAQKARRSYGRAWDLLSDGEDLLTERDRRLGRPVQIRKAQPPAYADEETDPTVNPTFRTREFDRGAVVAAFTVNSRGRTEDIRIVESEPPGLMDQQVERAVRRFVFRPRFEAGEPVATPGQTFRHTYSYIEERLPDEIRAAVEAREAATSAAPVADSAAATPDAPDDEAATTGTVPESGD